MQAFGLLGSQNALGSMDVLAGGIAKALVTTAAGLIVSIPSLIFYNHFTHQVGNIILAMETTANDIVSLIIYGGQNGEDQIKNDKEAPNEQEKKQDLFV
jgi:biopolymer transport protein ExbB